VQITRVFTEGLDGPLDGIGFERRDSKIVDADGTVRFEMKDVEIPASWSDRAGNILVQKYFRKAGVPSRTRRVTDGSITEMDLPGWLHPSEPAKGSKKGAETSVKQVFHRMAGAWTYWGMVSGLLVDEEQAQIFYDELVRMLATQVAAPNSPQWFNTGLNWAYGIESPAQGHYRQAPGEKKAKPTKNAYENPQVHACYIQDIDDNLVNEGGIMDLWVKEARLFKYGSGTGTNFSKLRGRDEDLSGGGVSSGVLSFLRVGDRAAGAIQSGGTTRRAAKIVILDVDHPDIEAFIQWKVTEEHKVSCMVAGSVVIEKHVRRIMETAAREEGADPANNKALARAIRRARRVGVPDSRIVHTLSCVEQRVAPMPSPVYDIDWQGEAYETVSGQQSNNSVRVTDKFMSAVSFGTTWNLVRRTDGKIAKTVMASDLWNSMIEAAWTCGDPGLQFHDTVNAWNTVLASGEIRATNPCGEYVFLEDTACNLASLNLCSFVDGVGTFHIAEFLQAIRIWTMVLEISVTMAQFPSKRMAERSVEFRTLGLGYANLGALLMRKGIAYDSREARMAAGTLTSALTAYAYATSAEMAGQLGAFPAFEKNKVSVSSVMLKHEQAHRELMGNFFDMEAHDEVDPDLALGDLLRLTEEVWGDVVVAISRDGLRNAQATALAPTGTIALVMDCDTTGVEPDYALVKFKSLAGGGYLRVVNESVERSLTHLGYGKRKIQEMLTDVLGTRELGSEFADLLKGVGFTIELLRKIEERMRDAYHFSFVITPDVVGLDNCVDHLHIKAEDLDDIGIHLLNHLKFSPERIAEFNEKSCGSGTLETARHIKPEHMPVFDCSGKCGAKGTRFIDPYGHLEMMKAVQPFLSGGISKTVNVPRETTMAQIHKLYMDAHAGGLKSITVYRDGSKLNQPLMSTEIAELLGVGEEELPREQTLDETMRVAERVVVRHLTRRRRLPYKRKGYTQKATLGMNSPEGHQKLFLHTGEYEDGTLGEIFVDTAKEGTEIGALMNAFCIAVSVGLQHGVPLERLVGLLVFTKFGTRGLVIGDERIKTCTSIIDYIFRHLAVNYLGRDELANVEASDVMRNSLQSEWIEEVMAEEEVVLRGDPQDSAQVPTEGVRIDNPVVDKTEYDMVRELGFDGEKCPECGHMTMVRQGGPCPKCKTCGHTPGCS